MPVGRLSRITGAIEIAANADLFQRSIHAQMVEDVRVCCRSLDARRMAALNVTKDQPALSPSQERPMKTAQGTAKVLDVRKIWDARSEERRVGKECRSR